MFISIAIYILFKKKKFFIFLKKKNSFLSKSQQKSGQIFGENARPPYLSDDWAKETNDSSRGISGTILRVTKQKNTGKPKVTVKVDIRRKCL